MRRILIDNARRKQALRHGGGQTARVDAAEVELPSPMPDEQLLALDEALDRLTEFDARAAEVVKLCFFVGLTQEEAARKMEISLRTAARLWNFARAFLHSEMKKE